MIAVTERMFVVAGPMNTFRVKECIGSMSVLWEEHFASVDLALEAAHDEVRVRKEMANAQREKSSQY